MKFKFDDVVLVFAKDSFYFGLVGFVKEYDEGINKYTILIPPDEYDPGVVIFTAEEKDLERLDSRPVDLDEIRKIWREDPDLKVIK